MGEVNFSCKEFSEEPSSTTAGSVEKMGEKILTTEEKIKEIEDTKEIAEFQNEVTMLNAYEKIGAMEFFGDLTEMEMSNLFNKTEETKKIRYELIPEHLVSEGGPEYKVYLTTEKYDPNSSAAQKITQNEYNCYVEIQEKTAQEYESLVDSGKMKRLGNLTPEEITKYKEENNIPNKNIKEVFCFDNDGSLIEESQCYYKTNS